MLNYHLTQKTLSTALFCDVSLSPQRIHRVFFIQELDGFGTRPQPLENWSLSIRHGQRQPEGDVWSTCHVEASKTNHFKILCV